MLGFVIVAVIKSALLIFIVLTTAAYLTLFERKVMGRLQVRYGPNRAGPFGLLQPLADGVKLALKEDVMPAEADKWVYLGAPVVTVVPAIIIFAVIPIGDQITLFGRTFDLYLTDVNVGLLYIFAVTSIGVYGVVLAGWSSNSKYPLLGGLRASAQMISYELAFGLSVVSVSLLTGSLSLIDIVQAQQDVWFIVLQPLGFLIFIVASVAEVNRAPFDLPEAEQELTGGFHTEYSGLKFALFFVGEYAKMAAVSGLAVALFLGGWWGPILPGVFWFAIKTVFFLFVFVWLRATFPRIRYHRLMALGWKVLLPLALANVVVTAAAIVLRDMYF